MSLINEIIKRSVAIAISAAMAASVPEEETTIRVLLMTTGYGGYFHDTVDYVENPEDGTFHILFHRNFIYQQVPLFRFFYFQRSRIHRIAIFTFNR